MKLSDILKRIVVPIRDHPVIWVILLIALIIRLYGLSFESFWLDEAMTGLRCRWDFSEMIDNIAGKDHLPFYFSSMWVYGKIFGTSEIALRAPSLLFGTLAIIPVFLLGYGISRKVAYISALITALHPTMIFYSQEARMYSMMFFLAALSLWLMKKMLDKERKKKAILIIVFILTNAILVYTHYFGLLFIGLECISIFLISIFRKNEGMKERILEVSRNIWPGILSMSLFLPWFIYVQLNYPFSGHVTGGGLTLSPDLIFFMYLFLGGSYKFHYDPILGITFFLSIVLILLCAMGSIFLLIRSIKDKRSRENLLIMLPIVLLTPLMVYFVSKNWQSIYNYRYMIFMGGPFVILASIPLGWDLLKKRMKGRYRNWMMISIIMVLIFMMMGTNLEMIQREDKDDWRGATDHILENRGNNDLVLPQPAHYRYSIYYYTRDLNVRSISDNSKNVSELFNNYDTIWVITFHYRDIDKYGFTDHLSNWYYEDIDDFRGLTVRRYWRK